MAVRRQLKVLLYVTFSAYLPFLFFAPFSSTTT